MARSSRPYPRLGDGFQTVGPPIHSQLQRAPYRSSRLRLAGEEAVAAVVAPEWRQ